MHAVFYRDEACTDVDNEYTEANGKLPDDAQYMYSGQCGIFNENVS